MGTAARASLANAALRLQHRPRGAAAQPCPVCWGFSSYIPYGGITDLGIGLVSAGCHLLAGNPGNGRLGAKFIPPPQTSQEGAQPPSAAANLPPAFITTCRRNYREALPKGGVVFWFFFLVRTTAPS